MVAALSLALIKGGVAAPGQSVKRHGVRATIVGSAGADEIRVGPGQRRDRCSRGGRKRHHFGRTRQGHRLRWGWFRLARGKWGPRPVVWRGSDGRGPRPGWALIASTAETAPTTFRAGRPTTGCLGAAKATSSRRQTARCLRRWAATHSPLGNRRGDLGETGPARSSGPRLEPTSDSSCALSPGCGSSRFTAARRRGDAGNRQRCGLELRECRVAPPPVSCHHPVLEVGDAGRLDGPDLLELHLRVPEVVEETSTVAEHHRNDVELKFVQQSRCQVLPQRPGRRPKA